MVSVNDLRAQHAYEEDGVLYQVLSYEHIKMGRGSANIKLKVKNLTNGSVVEKSYINTAKVNDISIAKKDLQFLYKDEENCYFMDPTTYEQINIPLTVITEHKYLKEGENFNIAFHGETPLYVTLPPKLVFTVAETGPSVKGNSATNVFKDAVLDNGIKVKVPLFINVGEKIRIDTRTGSYTEKAQ